MSSIIYLLFLTALTYGEDDCRSKNPDNVCTTPGCYAAAASVSSNLDPLVAPCEDFYRFACGGFVARTTIPDDKSIVISFNAVSDHVDQQLRALLEEPREGAALRPFELLQKLYQVCMNTSAIEDDNMRTAKRLLRELGGWPVLEPFWDEAHFDWKEAMYKFRQAGLPTYSLLAMYVGLDTKNSSKRVITFDQAIMGLEREYLMEGFENDMVQAYYSFLVDIAELFGANRTVAMLDFEEMLEFEMLLAGITMPREQRRNLTALYNPMTVAELQVRFPSIPWLDYINNIIALPGIKLVEDDIVDASVPEYIYKLEKLLLTTAKKVQANYLMSQVVIRMVSLLTKELRQRQLEYSRLVDGTRAFKPRWKECSEIAAGGMKIAASALYVRRFFNENAKRKANVLVSDLRDTFMEILREVEWMDEKTKTLALQKARAMQTHIAYPPELLDDRKIEKYYTGLEPSDNFLKYALQISKFADDNAYKRLPEAVNRTEWIRHASSTKVNAYYSNSDNSIEIPAGILQGVFFDADRPNYMNYGAIGYIIGHEITHGFDDIGRQYNEKGELEEWWAANTKKSFINKAQCIIDQYGNYSLPLLNVQLNGINTQGENIADNGGLKEAYLAYKHWVTRNGEEPKLPGLDYTPQQMFWISSANLWCAKERNEYLKQHVMTDTHSPSYFRVLGAFSNNEEFAKDFKCREGSPMNPTEKCRVW